MGDEKKEYNKVKKVDEPGRKSTRQANMELLRCLAMMMVVALHFLGKGEILADLTKDGAKGYEQAAWVLEALCIVAVNLYMLLSGFFGWKSNFRLSRLLRLYLQIWFYSAVVGLGAFALWGYPKDSEGTYFFLKLLFPVSMEHYWFMTAYVFLYLLLPLIQPTLRSMSRTQMKAAIVILLVFFCLLKSVLPVRLETDQKGYDFIWYLCMYTIGAYIGRFHAKHLESDAAKWRKNGMTIYFLGIFGVLFEIILLNRIYIKTGKLSMLLKVSTEYNHIFPMVAAVGLFLFFACIRIQGKGAGVILKAAPYTLGVYLLHENMGLRYLWQEWLGAKKIDSVVSLVLWTAFAVCTVFVTGVFVDKIRSVMEEGLWKFFSRFQPFKKLTKTVRTIDSWFINQKAE